jgi:hypothetical protein
VDYLAAGALAFLPPLDFFGFFVAMMISLEGG